MAGSWLRLLTPKAAAEARRLLGLFMPGPPVLIIEIWHTEGGISMTDLSVKDTDPDPSVSIVPLDIDGNPTTADDVPQYTSSDETVATVAAAVDGLSAAVTKTGKVGATAIGVSSTRSSDGVVLQGSATLTVTPSEEATIQVDLAPGA